MKKLQYFIDLDKQFLKDVQTLGAEGWIKYMADDIVFAQINYMNIGEGKELASKVFNQHYKTENIYYSWESRNFDISEDQTLVNYISEFYFQEMINDKKLEYEGVYIFTWKLVNGEYKISKMITGWKS